MELPFKRLDPDAELPGAQHPGDAGLDLRATIDVEVGPGERAMIATGIAVAIPAGHAGLVLPRSGLASKQGLTLANRSEAVRIARGDRIAQLVIVTVPEVAPRWVEELPDSSRGEGGFGSTGRS